MDLGNLLDVDEREGQIKLNTCTNTCTAGKNFCSVKTAGETVDVTPFSPEWEVIADAPIDAVEMAHASPETSKTVALVGHQHLHSGDWMHHSLWNPNQLQHCNGKVHDCPKQFDLDSAPFVI